MGKLVVPDNVTSLRIAGTVLIPDQRHEVVVTAGVASETVPQQFQPKLISTDAAGIATVKLSPWITEIAFDGVNYVGDGQNQIVLPPLVANGFLGAQSWKPFKYYEPLPVVLPLPTRNFNLLAGPLPAEIVFTRASTATYWDAAGVLQVAAVNTPRFDYDPVTLAVLGLLVEESRTNSNPNNTMVGAVAGTPGVVPTGWVDNVTASGLSRQIVGTGIEDGINYIDIRFSGVTTTATSANVAQFTANTATAAVPGQNWAISVFARVVGGTLNNVTGIILVGVERNAAGSSLATNNVPISMSAGSLRTSRTVYIRPIANALAVFVTSSVNVAHTGVGAAVDITLRIGLPQLELGLFPTSPIKTTAAVGVRAVDNAEISGANFSAFWNPAAGTLGVNFASFYPNGAPGFARALAATNAAGTDYISLARRPGTSTALANLTLGGVSQLQLEPRPMPVNTFVNLVAGFVAGDYATVADGSAVLHAFGIALPVVDRLQIGWLTGLVPVNGWIKSVRYWNAKLSDEQLAAASLS